MPHWKTFKGHDQVRVAILDIVTRLRSGDLKIGRHEYALSLAVGVWQAILCGNDKLAAIEMGVFSGAGLMDLCAAAQFFRDEFELDIEVFGYDRGKGLPKPADYRDHPEIWFQSEYDMGDPAVLRAKLPSFAHLVIGDICDTAGSLEQALGNRKLAFVSVDVDYYSSTVDCLKVLTFPSHCYMPTVPMYFDDVDVFLTFNEFCGEELAIREFNQANAHRKIVRNRNFRIKRFHVCHILDHGLRTGAEANRQGFLQRVRAF